MIKCWWLCALAPLARRSDNKPLKIHNEVPVALIKQNRICEQIHRIDVILFDSQFMELNKQQSDGEMLIA